MKQCALTIFLLMSVVCYGQFKDKTLDVIRMEETKKLLEQIPSGSLMKDTSLLFIPQTKREDQFLKNQDYSLYKYVKKLGKKWTWTKEYYFHTIKGIEYLKNNDSIQSIPCLLSADSVILKHPELLENDSVKRIHSYVLFRLGLTYLDTHTLEGYEKATYYLDRSESLGYKEAYIFSNISRSGTYMIQRIKNRKDSKPLQKDSVSSNSE